MFEVLLWITVAVCIAGLLVAWDGSRDMFHPLMFLAPMCIFLYGWMPLKMHYAGELTRFFTGEQLHFIAWFNLAGVSALIVGCLAAGTRPLSTMAAPATQAWTERRLAVGGAIAGGIGLTCWIVTIVNVGGFVNAFSKSYSGGWDESGYIRDAGILLLVGVLLQQAAIAVGRARIVTVSLLLLFATPWFVQAMLTSRRGPTFTFTVMVVISWFVYRSMRPPLVLTAAGGLALGYLLMFLVVNRGNIHLGSEMDFRTDVSDEISTTHTGNEFVYGTGTVLASERRGHYYWGLRYLAQVTVRPIPTAIWPTKYADFGVPELLKNAGTGEGFGELLGWEGAPGSAPGIIADLWLEFSWGAIVFMAFAGWIYGRVWQLAISRPGPWMSQYLILVALSIYFVMQTMEAVIFRAVILSIPSWLTWKWALVKPAAAPHKHAVRFDRLDTSLTT